MKTYFLHLILIVVLLVSCKEEAAEIPTNNQNKFDVSQQVAMSMARRMNLDNPYQSNASNSRPDSFNEIEWVQVMDNGENSAGFFVINFTDNAGFVILSGDYRTVPVFGVSSSGSFPSPGDTIDQGMAMMLEEALDHLIYTRDTLDLPNIPEDLLQLWIGAGLDGALPAPGSCDCTESDQDWDCHIQCEASGGSSGGGGSVSWDAIVETHGPLMDTQWGQGEVYNYYAPYMNCSANNGKALTGCVAVAMAQIINYWEYPTSYQYRYNEMTSGDKPNLAIASLMAICGNYVNMNYDCNVSLAYLSKATNVFKNDLGYSNSADYRSYNAETVKNNILANKPVMLRGCVIKNYFLRFIITYDGCHVWVADGVRQTTTPSNGLTLNEFHMNWGWGEDGGNGWFTDFNSNAANYQYSKKMGVNIYP